MNVKGNLKDKARVIQSWSEFANTDFHTTFYKENIVNITFLDSAVVPSNAVSCMHYSAMILIWKRWI